MTNLADKKDTLKDSDNRQRYEHFSYSKQISSRRNAKPISRDLKDVAGGGNLARENTFASSYVSQDKNKKPYTERREQPHKDNHSDKYKDLKKICGVNANKKDKSKTEPEREKGLEKVVPNKSELQALEQSGIYQIDLSSIRNEIPPMSDNASLPPLSANTDRSRLGRLPSREKLNRPEGSRYGQRTKAVSKKWRDDCDCLRCGIIKRQFMEGDASYTLWGNYPCMKILKSRISCEISYYDSD